ncbi:MAG: helix-turn-helix transcriptional regulator [Paracoccaceae bacterium]
MTRLNPITWLWALFVAQAVCAAFFLLDAVKDLLGLENLPGFRNVDTFEMLVSVCLVAGLGVTAMLIRDMTRRQAALKRQVDVASGAFARVIEEHFDTWGLSASERDVAMLAIKGLSIAEIAALRNTKEGTVKAQNAAVYRKAGVSGRLQLLSLFIEELLAEPLVDAAE